MGNLSTHILDTAHGIPAQGVIVELHLVDGPERCQVHITAVTNTNGRTDEPLLTADNIVPGTYELTYHIGDYFRRRGVILTDPPFLDKVVIRFGIADPTANYHVPLLVSPYGYTTYRGS
jgi:5-hydroxyisourate hydrolase